MLSGTRQVKFNVLEDKKVKYIAIEGVIGVGKTSLAKKTF